MPRYFCCAFVTVTCHTYVEADSPEEAVDIARNRAMGTFCHTPMSDDADDAWIIEEADGYPFDIDVEEA